MLSGGSGKDPKEYFGRKIVDADFSDDSLVLTFEDGVKIKIFDDGQSCCEARYMRTDDEVSFLKGKTLTGIESKDATSTEDPDGYGEHEVVFLEIQTDQGSITFSNHNEHNGYYGGFGLSIEELN